MCNGFNIDNQFSGLELIYGSMLVRILDVKERGYTFLEMPDRCQRTSTFDNFEGMVLKSNCSIPINSKIQFTTGLTLDLANDLCIVKEKDIVVYWEKNLED